MRSRISVGITDSRAVSSLNVRLTVINDNLAISQTYYFARDDRVFKAFQERVRACKDSIARTCTRRLKWQIRVLERVMEGRSITYRVSSPSATHIVLLKWCSAGESRIAFW
jgi:hypothetical protein